MTRGGVTRPVHRGSVNATEQPPRHSPPQLPVARVTQRPWQTPPHAPPEVELPAQVPSQTPSQAPLTSTAQWPVHWAEHPPRSSPPSQVICAIAGWYVTSHVAIAVRLLLRKEDRWRGALVWIAVPLAPKPPL